MENSSNVFYDKQDIKRYVNRIEKLEIKLKVIEKYMMFNTYIILLCIISFLLIILFN